MKEILVVGMGGFIGASFRHAIGIWTSQLFKTGFPFGTFFVNVVGCFLIGFFFSLGFDKNTELPLKEFMVIGILGGFTTFSAFGFETFTMLKSGQFKLAIIYILSSMIFGLISVGLGMSISR